MVISVKNLKIKYPYGAEAVKDLSFSLEKGQKLAVFSHAEGGKSSLIKCLSGIVKPVSGEILIEGRALDFKKDVLTVYETEGIFNYKKVIRQLEYPLKLRKISRPERIKKVYETANECKIMHLLGTLGRQLSEEDKARVKMSRIKLREVPLVLIDNPLGALRSQQRMEVFRQFLPIVKSVKSSLIYTTDSFDEALSVGDYVLILNYGIVIMLSTPTEILNNPKQLFVYRLVNPYNRYVEKEEVIISQRFVEDEAGERSKRVGYFYLNNQLYVNLENDIVIKADKLKEYYFVKLLEERMFDTKNEIIINN